MSFIMKMNNFGKKAVIAAGLAALLILPVLAQKTGSQAQGKRYGEPGFVGESINLNVVKTDVRDLLNYITDQYGVNFVIDRSVKEVPVTVNVTDEPWNLVLDSVLSANGLGVQIKGSILRVADIEILAKESEINARVRESQIELAPLYTEFVRLNYACAGKCASAGGFEGGNTSDSGGGGGAEGAEGILGTVKKRLSKRGSVETDPRSNTLIITDVRENIDAIRALVKLLDQPEPQVEIEARIVIASRNFSRDIGVQLAGLGFGGNGAGGSIATMPGSQVASTGGSASGQNTTGFRPLGSPAGLILEPTRSLTSSLAHTVIGLTTGEIGSVQLSMLITAGEEKGQAKTIATPRITTLNNRKAEIESGQQIPVVTTQNSGNNTGAVVFTTTFVSVPLRLSVTPQITDAGTVILRVVAENNTISRTVTIGGTPGINTQRMQTEVMVPDGGTTVVGGAMLDNEGEDQFRTPGLSSIPVLGKLFKRKAVARNTSEILFFITPRIYRSDYAGNRIDSKVGNETRTTTLIQPVPMGNPSSNSGTPEPTPQQPLLIPVTGLQGGPQPMGSPKP
ncbi:MAG TPA: type IV pilus secretin PilQ [Pyrinomonadaceae bacterium]|nr:type IV pilus secretin PilQ [Pyrinomonadaceae bacterium]